VVAKREIASVLWHQQGNYIKVVYVGGDPEHLVGNQAMAAELAENAGLKRVPTNDGTLRWVRTTTLLNADRVQLGCLSSPVEALDATRPGTNRSRPPHFERRLRK